MFYLEAWQLNGGNFLLLSSKALKNYFTQPCQLFKRQKQLPL
jgi:hypothetical protein